MERLTKEKQIGQFASLKDKAEAVPGAFGSYDCLYAHMVAVTRLKEYEDTGLEPKEVTELMAAHGTAILELSEYRSVGPTKHLKELAQAEKDGRLVVLPCKVGDTVYVTYGEGYKPCIVDRMYIMADNQVQIRMRHNCNETLWLSDAFGKTVFLTRAEAEAVLKGWANRESLL